MKAIYTLLILLLLMSCEDNTMTKTISVLKDTTEADFKARPEAETIITKFGLETNKWQAITFRYKRITHVSHTPQQEISLESGTSFVDNELERDNKVAFFKKELKKMLQDSISEGKQHSAIFKPLVKEIITLQQDSSSTSTIYLFSDLQENDPSFFSVYNPYHLKTLEQQPDKVKQRFMETAEGILGQAQKVKIIVIYEPTTIAQDQKFTQMKLLYQSIFKALGVHIEFHSNM